MIASTEEADEAVQMIDQKKWYYKLIGQREGSLITIVADLDGKVIDPISSGEGEAFYAVLVVEVKNLGRVQDFKEAQKD